MDFTASEWPYFKAVGRHIDRAEYTVGLTRLSAQSCHFVVSFTNGHQFASPFQTKNVEPVSYRDQGKKCEREQTFKSNMYDSLLDHRPALRSINMVFWTFVPLPVFLSSRSDTARTTRERTQTTTSYCKIVTRLRPAVLIQQWESLPRTCDVCVCRNDCSWSHVNSCDAHSTSLSTRVRAESEIRRKRVPQQEGHAKDREEEPGVVWVPPLLRDEEVT